MSVGYIALCMTLAARVQQGRTLLLQAGLFTVLTTVSNAIALSSCCTHTRVV
jgi:hypothetical protein